MMRIHVIIEGSLLIFLALLLLATNLVHVLEASSSQDEKSRVQNHLKVINKQSIKSFMTKYGDILDCVEIDKQFAFDHPLLKNHSIQMKPNFKVSKQTTTIGRSSKILTPSNLVPKHMRCPRGSVLIKRIQDEDLALQKFSSFSGMKYPTTNSVTDASNYDAPPGYQTAAVISPTPNMGASGVINVWSPDVIQGQLSNAAVFVSSDDVSGVNGVAAGWAVSPSMFGQNSSRLVGYWTKDGGKSTGCFNGLCPGFVQISQKVTLGVLVQPVSTYNGDQYFMKISIKQEVNTKNWWLFYGDEGVGYWPKELFGTLANGAARAGWGGEISNLATAPAPGMGSGHFPEEGPKKACVIYGLTLYGSVIPKENEFTTTLSKPNCYRAIYAGIAAGEFGRYMYFGGPPDCTSLT